MYERSMVTLPVAPTSKITCEMVREIFAIDDFQITYSAKDMSWTRLAIENLTYMIGFEQALGSDVVELQRQKAHLQLILDKNGI